MGRDEEIEKESRRASYYGDERDDEYNQEGSVSSDDDCSYLVTRIDDSYYSKFE